MKIPKLLTFVCCAFALTFQSGSGAAQGQTPLSAQSSAVTWICSAFYLPARSIWKRSVTVDYNTEGIKAVSIDGIPVYSYSLFDSSILTAIDGERIQFDATAQTWTSDLRGVVSSQGRCER